MSYARPMPYGAKYNNYINNNNNNNNGKPTANNVRRLHNTYKKKQSTYKRYYGNNAAFNGAYKQNDKRGFFKRLFGIGKPTLYRKGANSNSINNAVLTRKNRSNETLNAWKKYNNASRRYTRKNR